MMRAGGNFYDEGAESLFSVSCTRLDENRPEIGNPHYLIAYDGNNSGTLDSYHRPSNPNANHPQT